MTGKGKERIKWRRRCSGTSEWRLKQEEKNSKAERERERQRKRERERER